LDVDPPPTLARPLRRAALRAAQGHLAIDAETERVVTLLGAAAVPCILIKGPARRVAAPPWLVDTRATSDVDVLVPAPHAETAWRALRSDGYEPLPLGVGAPAPRGELWGVSPHHLQPLVRPGGVAVDLHVSTQEELAPDEAWQRLCATARECRWRDRMVRVPSATEMTWHALTHAKAMYPPGWRLRFFLDAATAMALGPLDWPVIMNRMDSSESTDPTAARRWLAAAADLAGVALPEALAPARPYAQALMLEWRLRVCGTRLGLAARGELLTESTRAALGLGWAPLVTARPLRIRVRRRLVRVARRRLVNVAARVAYAVWGAGRV
jgi:hypothetical protein